MAKDFECLGECETCTDLTCSLKVEDNLSYKNKDWWKKYWKGTEDQPKTEAVTKLCKPHEEWKDIGIFRVFMKSSGGRIPPELDVYIDLTGYAGIPQIPQGLEKYLDKPGKSCKMVVWEVKDGSPGPQALVNFVYRMLKDGLTVGWGCVGGHGRTGWLAAKLYKEVMGCSGDEAVTWVRDKYCEDAVESQAQLTNLGCSDRTKPTRVTTVVYYQKGY